MKKYAFASILLILVAIGIVFVSSYNRIPLEPDNPLENPLSGEPEEIPTLGPNSSTETAAAVEIPDYEMVFYNEYVSTKADNLLNDADIVFVGEYDAGKKTYADSIGRPVTIGEFSVSQVIKGQIGENVDIHFIGGVISIQEYAANKSPESLEKIGLTKEVLARSNETLGIAKTETSIDAKEGESYLVFALHDPRDDTYHVMSDAYGMRPMDTLKRALNPDTGLYEQLDIIN